MEISGYDNNKCNYIIITMTEEHKTIYVPYVDYKNDIIYVAKEVVVIHS